MIKKFSANKESPATLKKWFRPTDGVVCAGYSGSALLYVTVVTTGFERILLLLPLVVVVVDITQHHTVPILEVIISNTQGLNEFKHDDDDDDDDVE